jgi:hypothetical protein
MSIDAMQAALEALYNMVEDGDETDKQQAIAAIAALRLAIEQAERQEPVGVVATDTSQVHVYYGAQYVGQKSDAKIVMLFKDLPLGTPVYTAPPQRREQAEKQEPVAWANINKHGDITHTSNKRMPWANTPLYIAPPKRQLTDEEIERACLPLGAAMLSFTEVARAIERAHGIGGGV